LVLSATTDVEEHNFGLDDKFTTSVFAHCMTLPVTLLQKEPEIQYVALRNINLIIQKRPQVLQSEMRVSTSFPSSPTEAKLLKSIRFSFVFSSSSWGRCSFASTMIQST